MEQSETLNAGSLDPVVRPRLISRRTPMLMAALAMASLGAASTLPTSIAPMRGQPKCPGFPIGAGEENGKPFTDSRGRKYVRDSKGTIRRVA